MNKRCPGSGKVRCLVWAARAAGAFACACAGCKRIIEAQDAPVFRCPHCRYAYDQRLLAPGAERPQRPPPAKR